MDKPLTHLRKAPAQERAAATFEAILDAAAHILREEGVQALSTNHIAARAGVSIGSLYQYFPNKQAITRALIERYVKRVEHMRPPILDDPHAAANTVMRAAVDWHFEAHRMDAKLAQAMRELASALLPIEEQARLAALRKERVARTVTRLIGDDAEVRGKQAAFLVDVCLRAISNETMRQHPGWLTSDAFRVEVSALLAGYLENNHSSALRPRNL
jgi:AcrR family transcriptional regulator